MRYEIPSAVQIRDLTHGQLNSGRISENLILKNKGKKSQSVTMYPSILKPAPSFQKIIWKDRNGINKK